MAALIYTMYVFYLVDFGEALPIFKKQPKQQLLQDLEAFNGI